MKILITGANGFIGKNLTVALKKIGHEITAASRDPALFSKALTGIDAVIHLAGEPVAAGRWSEERKKKIMESRTHGSKALFDAMRSLPSQNRPKVVVSASAIGFYGDRAGEILDETCVKGEGFLSDVCEKWEAETLPSDMQETRKVVVRIGMVLGIGGGALQTMSPLFRAGLGGRSGSGEQWMSWIHIDDLVGLFIHLLTQDTVTGIVNGVSPTAVTNIEFTKALAHACRRPAWLSIPDFALKLALGEMASMVLNSERVIPLKAIGSGFSFKYSRLDEALASLF